ncbi:MAG: GNAT family protein [Chloroflexota bacterium]|nr:GNAT family protein [Chloroflexota bacterium]
MNTNIVVDGEILLRRASLVYTDEIFALIDSNRSHLREWVPWVDSIKTRGDERDWIKARVNFADELRQSHFMMIYKGAVAGLIAIMNLGSPNKACEIGYWLGEEFQGKGIVTKSCRILIAGLFEKEGMRRVQIRAATYNHRSRAIPERLGFVLEGIQRQAELVNGRFYDLAMYSVLADEWGEKNELR